MMTTTDTPELQPLTDSTLATLLKITQDRIDAMRLAADLYAMGAYAAEARLAEASGTPNPPLPKPISKFLRGFLSHLRSWFETMARELRGDEIERLKKIGLAFLGRVNDEPELLSGELFTV